MAAAGVDRVLQYSLDEQDPRRTSPPRPRGAGWRDRSSSLSMAEVAAARPRAAAASPNVSHILPVPAGQDGSVHVHDAPPTGRVLPPSAAAAPPAVVFKRTPRVAPQTTRDAHPRAAAVSYHERLQAVAAGLHPGHGAPRQPLERVEKMAPFDPRPLGTRARPPSDGSSASPRSSSIHTETPSPARPSRVAQVTPCHAAPPPMRSPPVTPDGGPAGTPAAEPQTGLPRMNPLETLARVEEVARTPAMPLRPGGWREAGDPAYATPSAPWSGTPAEVQAPAALTDTAPAALTEENDRLLQWNRELQRELKAMTADIASKATPPDRARRVEKPVADESESLRQWNHELRAELDTMSSKLQSQSQLADTVRRLETKLRSKAALCDTLRKKVAALIQKDVQGHEEDPGRSDDAANIADLEAQLRGSRTEVERLRQVEAEYAALRAADPAEEVKAAVARASAAAAEAQQRVAAALEIDVARDETPWGAAFLAEVEAAAMRLRGAETAHRRLELRVELLTARAECTAAPAGGDPRTAQLHALLQRAEEELERLQAVEDAFNALRRAGGEGDTEAEAASPLAARLEAQLSVATTEITQIRELQAQLEAQLRVADSEITRLRAAEEAGAAAQQEVARLGEELARRGREEAAAQQQLATVQTALQQAEEAARRRSEEQTAAPQECAECVRWVEQLQLAEDEIARLQEAEEARVLRAREAETPQLEHHLRNAEAEIARLEAIAAGAPTLRDERDRLETQLQLAEDEIARLQGVEAELDEVLQSQGGRGAAAAARGAATTAALSMQLERRLVAAEEDLSKMRAVEAEHAALEGELRTAKADVARLTTAEARWEDQLRAAEDEIVRLQGMEAALGEGGDEATARMREAYTELEDQLRLAEDEITRLQGVEADGAGTLRELEAAEAELARMKEAGEAQPTKSAPPTDAAAMEAAFHDLQDQMADAASELGRLRQVEERYLDLLAPGRDGTAKDVAAETAALQREVRQLQGELRRARQRQAAPAAGDAGHEALAHAHAEEVASLEEAHAKLQLLYDEREDAVTSLQRQAFEDRAAHQARVAGMQGEVAAEQRRADEKDLQVRRLMAEIDELEKELREAAAFKEDFVVLQEQVRLKNLDLEDARLAADQIEERLSARVKAVERELTGAQEETEDWRRRYREVRATVAAAHPDETDTTTTQGHHDAFDALAHTISDMRHLERVVRSAAYSPDGTVDPDLRTGNAEPVADRRHRLTNASLPAACRKTHEQLRSLTACVMDAVGQREVACAEGAGCDVQ